MSSSDFDGFQQFQERYTLNRSASFSGMPVRKRVLIEERLIPSYSGTTIFRQYSCEEVSSSPVKNIPEICILRHCVSEVHIPKESEEKWNINNFQIKSKSAACPKYLAIDGCKESIPNFQSMKNHEDKLTDSHFPTQNPPKPEDKTNTLNSEEMVKAQDLEPVVDKVKRLGSKVRKHSRKVMPKKIFKSPERNRFYSYIFILLVPLCVFTAFYLDFLYNSECYIVADVDGLKEIMLSKVFGQTAAIKDIISAVEMFNSNEVGLKLLVIAGTIGVGKTYAASLIEEQFPWKSNIHHLVMPLSSDEVTLRTHSYFSSCGGNLVVVDGLLKDDASEAVQFAKHLSVVSKVKRILALFIFSFPHPFLESGESNITEEYSILKNKLLKAGVDFTFVTFQPLEKQHVISCIEAALSKNSFLYSKQQVDLILEDLNPLQDGCKRVSSKVPLYVEKTDL